MRSRTRSLIVASLLSALLLTASAFNVVHAAGNPPGASPNYETCSNTYWDTWGTGWWSDSGNASNYNYKLTVSLNVLRDSVNDTYCGQFQTLASLRYHNVSASGEVVACIVDTDSIPGYSSCLSAAQPPAGSTFNVVNKFSPALGITHCGYATGEWRNPAIDQQVRVPVRDSHCE